MGLLRAGTTISLLPHAHMNIPSSVVAWDLELYQSVDGCKTSSCAVRGQLIWCGELKLLALLDKHGKYGKKQIPIESKWEIGMSGKPARSLKQILGEDTAELGKFCTHLWLTRKLWTYTGETQGNRADIKR